MTMKYGDVWAHVSGKTVPAQLPRAAINPLAFLNASLSFSFRSFVDALVISHLRKDGKVLSETLQENWYPWAESPTKLIKAVLKVKKKRKVKRCKVQSAKCKSAKVQSAKCKSAKVQKCKSAKVQKCKVPSAKCQVQSAKYIIQKTKNIVRSKKWKVKRNNKLASKQPVNKLG